MGGRWWRGRVVCVGDAAHAVNLVFLIPFWFCLGISVTDASSVSTQMPPQGQSVGICLGDVILLSRLLAKYQPTTASDVTSLFTRYDSLRRPHITKAHKQAIKRWE